jgi:serine/threonine-protein kinase HipA
LPLRDEPFDDGAAHYFFSNLLPEGGARQAVCARLGISESNDFALLKAIGGECAGALVVTTPDATVENAEHRYERITDARLRTLLQDTDPVPLLIGCEKTRLSLAGAQDKLPVALFDDKLHLPLEGAPSTHILKLPNARFPHLAANEAFVMGLATRVELDVAPCELLTRFGPPILLVTRYDRIASAQSIVRLHQEDLCQALGLPPSRKYEQEGGPSLVRALELVRRHVTRPLEDVRRLIAWQAFNVIAGNADGHGKNLSLLYADGGRLAPFYDLVSTRQYTRLDSRLAMGVGGRRNMEQLHRAQWTAFAEGAAVRPGTVIDIVRDTATRCLAELPAWQTEFRDRYGANPILQTLPKWIRNQARRTLRALQT